MFSNTYTPGFNIYINGNVYRDISVYCMLERTYASQGRVNLYFNNVLNNVFNRTAASLSLTGNAITWTAMDNGFYNSARNIYCYYNYLG